MSIKNRFLIFDQLENTEAIAFFDDTQGNNVSTHPISTMPVPPEAQADEPSTNLSIIPNK